MVVQLQPQQQPLKLVKKLAQIMSEIDRIPKRGLNTYHGYQYVQESDLVDAIRGKLAQNHIFLFQSIEDERREGTLTTLRIRYTFMDGDCGESFDVCWVGQGDDKGDKGAYKALTGALKYLLLKHFLIPTGDDPEAAEGPEAKTRSHRQQQSRETTGRPERSAGRSVKGEPSGQTNDAIPKVTFSAKGTHHSELAALATAEDIKRVFKYGRGLELTVDELADLLAQVRGGNRSTKGMTTIELLWWHQQIDEFSNKRTVHA